MANKWPKNYIGRKSHPLYVTWKLMRQRCLNPNLVAYPAYGGRGITIDPRWDEFWNFVEDMGEKPRGMSLDRIDNDGPYCKENCKWSTKKEQAENRRNTRLVEFRGKRQTLSDWARELGMGRSTLAQRFYSYNWPIEQVLKEYTI